MLVTAVSPEKNGRIDGDAVWRKLAYNPKQSLISRVSGVHIGATLGIRWTDLYGADAACLHRPLPILLSRGGLYALLFAFLTDCLSVH